MTSIADRLPRLAVLIDADNIPARIASPLFEKIATLGEACVRRAYGDFTEARLKPWSDIMSAHAILPGQTFAYAVGKNASDIALVIDAMDLLFSGGFDGFCLISSDSDFTRLAARIREQGVDVFGFGARNTPESFRKACKRFIYIEKLDPAPESANLRPAIPVPPTPTEPGKHPPSAAVPLIMSALNDVDHANGWYALGALGKRLKVLTPDFDPRSYGCPKMATLIEKCGKFHVRRNKLAVHIRPK